MSAPKAEVRDAKLYAPFYNGLAAALALIFIGNGIKTLLTESLLDSTYMRFALFAVLPLLFCVSLFFTLQIVQNVTMAYVLYYSLIARVLTLVQCSTGSDP